MYLEHFGLEKEAFHISPDPEFLFLSPSHKEALAVILYGIEKRTGFMLITGGVGLGKTTILRSALERLDKVSIRVILLFNPAVSYDNLVRTIFRDLDIKLPESKDPFDIEEALHLKLIEEYKHGRTVVLIIDEAQNLPADTLERLRILSNLETDKEKLIQIILLGQEPELDRMLDSVQLRQIKQRVAVRAKIVPLTEKSSREYILHRLRKAGCGNEIPFTDSALRAVIKHARGIPRTINIVCDNALITGYGYRKKKITPKIVREVIKDLQGLPRKSIWRWLTVPIAALVCLAVLLTFFPHLRSFLPDSLNPFPSATPVEPTPLSRPAPTPAAPKPEVRDQNTAKPREPLMPQEFGGSPRLDAPTPAKAPGTASVEPPVSTSSPSERRPLPAVPEVSPPKPPPKEQTEPASKSEEVVVRSPSASVIPAPPAAQEKAPAPQPSLPSPPEARPAAALPVRPEDAAKPAATAREPLPSAKPPPQPVPEAPKPAVPAPPPSRQNLAPTQDQEDLIDWVIDHRAKTRRGSN